MAKVMGKWDRTARLLRVEHILYQNRRAGLTIGEIARTCGVSERTTRRDLNTLELELGIKIWQQNGRWGVIEDQYLPPIRFTLSEALNVFLAARLMLNYSHRNDPNVASIFTKLNSIVRPPLRDQIKTTIDWMQKLPRNEKYLHILSTLAEAWVSQRKVKIAYRSLPSERATERLIEPYFIEPAAPGHSSYVIAYCHRMNSIRTFKIERVTSAELTLDTYTIRSDFEANEFLGSSWGIVVEGEVKTIKLKFIDPTMIRIIEETTWHPSQVLEKRDDGSMLMTLRVTDTVDLFSWILGWGERVEVLEPMELRHEITDTAKAMLDIYQQGH